jgi:integrase
LKHHQEGRPRTLYSLRHTYICFRLMEGADIYMLTTNCRTSAEMIEKYHTVHWKGVLDASSNSVSQLALVLALWSGQRQGDLLRLPWSAYESPYIRLRQSKGGRRVAMPAGAPLRTLLDVTERRGPLILTNTLGRPWTSDGFRTSWGKACERAGIGDLTFHDLRGTAVVRLAIAGASVPQIAAVTGHSLKDVEAILDAHYLGRDIQLAEAAVLKLEARTKL